MAEANVNNGAAPLSRDTDYEGVKAWMAGVLTPHEVEKVIQKLADNDEDLTGAVLLGIPDDFEVFVTTLKNELDIKNFSIRQKLFDAVAAARRGPAGADPADEAAADGDGGEAARGSNARAPLANIDLNAPQTQRRQRLVKDEQAGQEEDQEEDEDGMAVDEDEAEEQLPAARKRAAARGGGGAARGTAQARFG
ncbi:hypothetical protein MNEG_14841 [Monoraphidium neglectum]|uniref:Uncharacterized protein n=1 Tax=Monoraphidium neglectum TaxID=145388 RepID=A0A0D2KAZ2_9CHLO|nr:hypothetical protein MNEG_14841 [Monoraphidium neglectum]KIY93123.1 hypothetical protein MNEG_14841 [Monoraphidium neglectum]|eukprot:XP_013892143.1 hypothetical protein MNEG_14841 [Monoraphidium neglectum]